MSEWIIVRADDHRPHSLGSNPSPFRVYGEGADPNAGGSQFDGSVEIIYLPVVREDPPTGLNEVLEQAAQQTTVGDNNIVYPGAYDAPIWVIGWDTVPQDIDVSRSVKNHALDVARDVRVNQGFILRNGQEMKLPLTKAFLDELQSSLTWLERAVAALEVESTYTMTFSGVGDYQVTLGIESLKAVVVDFGKAYYEMNAEYVGARNEIAAAQTPAAVDAVTWEF